LTGSISAAECHRVLATLLFTDIVGSTARAEQLGDQRWRNLLDAHHTTVRRELARARGNEVRSLGDGFLATFDGPARAVRCARAIAEAIGPLDIQVRSGLHTGEIEIVGNDVQGIAVPDIHSRASRNRWTSMRPRIDAGATIGRKKYAPEPRAAHQVNE
jgi:class 3 adenylate cyclase